MVYLHQGPAGTRTDISIVMMASDTYRKSRLARRLYEASIVFVFATVVALLLLFAVGVRTHERFGCATKSIATASARCTGAAELRHDLRSGDARVVFTSDPSPAAR